MIALSVPNGFPFHDRPLKDRPNSKGIFSKQSIQRLDFLGTALLLVTCIFLVAALEMGGVDYPWKSAFVCHVPNVAPPPPIKYPLEIERSLRVVYFWKYTNINITR